MRQKWKSTHFCFICLYALFCFYVFLFIKVSVLYRYTILFDVIVSIVSMIHSQLPLFWPRVLSVNQAWVFCPGGTASEALYYAGKGGAGSFGTDLKWTLPMCNGYSTGEFQRLLWEKYRVSSKGKAMSSKWQRQDQTIMWISNEDHRYTNSTVMQLRTLTLRVKTEGTYKSLISTISLLQTFSLCIVWNSTRTVNVQTLAKRWHNAFSLS